MAAHVGRHPSESSRIVERSGQPLGFLEIPPDRRELVQREERRRRSRRRSIARSTFSGVSGSGCNAPRACSRLVTASRYAERASALAPACRRYVTAFSHSSPGRHGGPGAPPARPADGVPRLQGLHDPGMEGAPTVLEQAPVRDLVREGVPEGVLEIREEARLVEELSRLEAGEPLAKAGLRDVGDGREERDRHGLPDDGSRLQQPLVLGHEPVDPRRQDRLHRRRELPGFRTAFSLCRHRRHPIGPAIPTSTRVSTKARTLSSRKKGFPALRSINTRLRGSTVPSDPSRAVSSASARLRR